MQIPQEIQTANRTPFPSSLHEELISARTAGYQLELPHELGANKI
jgi:hypothetical protein